MGYARQLLREGLPVLLLPLLVAALGFGLPLLLLEAPLWQRLAIGAGCWLGLLLLLRLLGLWSLIRAAKAGEPPPDPEQEARREAMRRRYAHIPDGTGRERRDDSHCTKRRSAD